VYISIYFGFHASLEEYQAFMSTISYLMRLYLVDYLLQVDLMVLI